MASPLPYDPIARDELLAFFRETTARLARIENEIERPSRCDRILTQAEAIAYTKHESLSAFYRWARRWRVTSAQNGRYARSQLDAALEREAQKKRPAKPAPTRSTTTAQRLAA